MPDKVRRWLLEQGLANERAEVRAAAVRILAAQRPGEVASRLSKLAGDSSLEVREAVALALAHPETKPTVALCERLVRDQELRVRVAGVTALARLDGERAEKLLASCATDKQGSWQTRLEAVSGLAARAPARHVEALLRISKETKADRRLRQAALEAVAAGRSPPAAPTAEDDAASSGRTRAKFFDLPIDSLRPCFIVDVSGSMGEPMPVSSGTTTAGAATLRTRLEVARAELARALGSLPKEASFGIILFSDRTTPIEDHPVPARPEAIAKALAQVAEYAPEGGTNLHAALATVLHGSAPRDPAAADHVEFDAIYLITDGLPTLGAATEAGDLRARVRAYNRFARVKLHTVAIGAESRALLQGLAQDSGGRCVVR